MKCTNCGTLMVKVDYSGEWFCPNCTKCPRCRKKPAVIDQFLGVLFCQSCRDEIRPDGDMRRFYLTDKTREYFATPFWKHMGLKPKKHEKAMEKWMKQRGYSYLDVQRLRDQQAKHSSAHLANQLERGELHGKDDVAYNRE